MTFPHGEKGFRGNRFSKIKLFPLIPARRTPYGGELVFGLASPLAVRFAGAIIRRGSMLF